MSRKRTVGIITMHRPISFGSSLQAYALQKKIEELGYDSQIIDYQYPNKLHKVKQNIIKVIVKYAIHYIMNIMVGLPCLFEHIRFKKFRKNYLKLSKYYNDADALVDNTPQYDIYCTGSDQVWNTNFTKGDTSFLLSFVKDKKKISYASSFAVDYVVEECQQNFRDYLSQYSAISVRESSGIALAKALAGKDAIMVCDPTLLLTKNEWFPLAEHSQIKIDKPYILVFILTYSYNPYPDVNHIIDEVQQKLGLHTVILNGNKYDYLRKNSTVIKNAGPLEFLYLFKNASFIITSSFHGVAFSANFEKPFLAVVNRAGRDSRLMSFMEHIGLGSRAVGYNETDVVVDTRLPDIAQLNDFRDQSLAFLKQALM